MGSGMTLNQKYRSEVKKHTDEARKEMHIPYGHTLDHRYPISRSMKPWGGRRHRLTAKNCGSKENLRAVPFQTNIQEGQTVTEDGIQALRDIAAATGDSFYLELADWHLVERESKRTAA